MTVNEYITAVLLLLTFGCTQPDEFAPDGQVRLDASITNLTRTAITNGSKATFTSNDKIGVFETLTGRSNVRYTYDESWTTTTPMYWRNGTSTHSFYAYYPYSATVSGTKVQIPVLSTQAMGSSVSRAADFLVAGPVSQTRAANVKMAFSHAFSLIQINIKIGITILNPYYLNRVIIQGGNPAGNSNRWGIANITGAPAQMGYDVVAGAFVAATNDASSYTQSFYSDVTPTSIVTTSFPIYILVLPGTYTTPKPAVAFRISVLGINSTTAFASFSTASSITFEAAKIYTYNISIGLLPTSLSAQPLRLTPEGVFPWDGKTIEQPL